MSFTLGTPVWTSDNRQLGTVDALIVDDRGAAIRAVVVQRNGELMRDVEVPIEALGANDVGHLVWSGAQADTESLTGFAVANYVEPQAGATLPAGYSATGLLVPSTGYVPIPSQPVVTSQQAAPSTPPSARPRA
jgi:hypothetical protein